MQIPTWLTILIIILGVIILFGVIRAFLKSSKGHNYPSIGDLLEDIFWIDFITDIDISDVEFPDIDVD